MTMARFLCVVCARGGSVGVPGKNIRLLLGVPLVARAIRTALGSKFIDEVIVSTDSPAIAVLAQEHGAIVPFMRPADISGATSGKFQVWQHAISQWERIRGGAIDILVDVDCTNPLIDSSDVTRAIEKFIELRRGTPPVDAIFTIAKARRNPYFNLVEPDEFGALRMSKSSGDTVLARQNAPEVFEHVAGVYVLDAPYLQTASHLLDGYAAGYEVPPEKALDVDSELDFTLVEYLLSARSSENPN